MSKKNIVQTYFSFQRTYVIKYLLFFLLSIVSNNLYSGQNVFLGIGFIKKMHDLNALTKAVTRAMDSFLTTITQAEAERGSTSYDPALVKGKMTKSLSEQTVQAGRKRSTAKLDNAITDAGIEYRQKIRQNPDFYKTQKPDFLSPDFWELQDKWIKEVLESPDNKHRIAILKHGGVDNGNEVLNMFGHACRNIVRDFYYDRPDIMGAAEKYFSAGDTTDRPDQTGSLNLSRGDARDGLRYSQFRHSTDESAAYQTDTHSISGADTTTGFRSSQSRHTIEKTYMHNIQTYTSPEGTEQNENTSEPDSSKNDVRLGQPVPGYVPPKPDRQRLDSEHHTSSYQSPENPDIDRNIETASHHSGDEQPEIRDDSAV